MSHGTRALARLLCGIALLPVGSARRNAAVRADESRWRLEPLVHDLGPESALESKSADFDGDGTPDPIIESDTSVRLVLSGGGEFRYSVGEMAEDSATNLTGTSLLSFRRDGRYPSLALATLRDEVGAQRGLVHQQVIFNDHGHLTLKALRDYPLSARDVDCARLGSTDLPVRFYASFGPDFGRSKAIELDPDGLRTLAEDTAYLNFRYRTSALYDGWLPARPVSAREQAAAMRDASLETIDSILATGWARAADSFVDSVRAIVMGLSDRRWLYSTDMTREYRLPWPVELSQARDLRRPPQDRWMDGYPMSTTTSADRP